MVRTMQIEFLKHHHSKVFGESNSSVCRQIAVHKFPVGYQAHMGYQYGPLMEPCAGRDGKPQEAAYRFDQTAAYVRSKIKNIKPN